MIGTYTGVYADGNSVPPRLRFHIKLSNNEGNELTLIGASGNASLKGGPKIGSMIPVLMADYFPAKGEVDLYADIELDHRKIEFIEEKRMGGDLWLTLRLEVLRVNVQSGKPVEQRSFECKEFPVETPQHTYEIKIPQSEWVGMLRDFGYGRTKVLEIPIPLLPMGTFVDNAIKQFDRAQAHFIEGNYEEVMVDCRKAFEEIDRAVKEGKIDFKIILGDSKSEKFMGVKNNVKDFANIGAHIGVPVDRRDAEMALHLTLATIGYVAKQLVKVSEKT